MFEIYAPKYNPSGVYQYQAYGYIPASGVTWEEKTFAGNTGDINAEIHFDDILVADNSKQNIMYTKNGDRLCFGYIPFYMKNIDIVDLYDVGYKLYNNPSQVEANTIGQTLASISDVRKDAAKTDNARGFAAFENADCGIFIRGIDSDLSRIQDLSNSIWTSTSSPGYLEIENNRIVISASSFIAAKDWHSASAFKTRTYKEDGFTITAYGIRKWNSGGRDSFLDNNIVSNDVDKTITVSPSEYMFGFIFFSTTDQNNTIGRITRNGSGFSIIQHGSWTGDDLIDSNGDDGVYMHNIRKPWNTSEFIDTRMIRYGLHFVARKVNV